MREAGEKGLSQGTSCKTSSDFTSTGIECVVPSAVGEDSSLGVSGGEYVDDDWTAGVGSVNYREGICASGMMEMTEIV